MISAIRRKTGAPLAGLGRSLLQMQVLPIALRRNIWTALERYVSFMGITGVARTRPGDRIAVDTSRMIEKQIYYFGEWEPCFSRYIADSPQPDRIFLDIGSNIGYFAILAARHYAQVIAIEASPVTFAQLQSNVALNRLANVVLVNFAVGDSIGKARFFVDVAHPGSSSLIAGAHHSEEMEVEVRPLFDLLDPATLPRIGLIKIDVEGVEHVVLQQIIDRLDDLPRDLKLFVEYGPERDGNMAEIFDRLLQAGFRARQMQGTYTIDEYLSPDARAPLTPLTAPPDTFCDVLFERS